MTKLIIKRSSHWLAREKEFRLYVNGEHMGTIKDGETQQYILEPGNHILKTEIDWLRSHTFLFEIGPDEQKIVKVEGGKYGYLLLPAYLLLLVLWYLLQQVMHIDYLLLWAAHLLLYIGIMSFFLFRKKRYVRELATD